MGKLFALFAAAVCVTLLAGCGSLAKGVTDSASSKNLGLDGYVMYGVVETNNPETATPQGKLIIGRLTYKSRKVGIPADQKVPNTGNFKATKTKSLFGTEEMIIEYDWTAGSDKDNQAAEKRLQELKEKAQKLEFEKDKSSQSPDNSADNNPVKNDSGE
ncbi:MAG: hypothetical protein PHI35_07700 [Victivallaceae bacterium]|nr:hypothetical protein [Victivallaceae bacterium]